MLNSEELEGLEESKEMAARRAMASDRAIKACYREILSTTEFTPQEALRLGANLVVRESEHLLQVGSFSRMEHESNIEDPDSKKNLIDEEVAETLEGMRSSYQTAVHGMMRGVYKPAKEQIQKLAKGPLTEMKYADSLRRKLLELLEAMPESGPKLKLPTPAYMHPEFAEPETD